MKYLFFALALFMIPHVHAQVAAPGDCKETARQAAESNYGDDPFRTQVRQLTADTYQVTVGIGNPESGAHTYQVTFEGPNCTSAVACDQTQPSSNDPRVCHQ